MSGYNYGERANEKIIRTVREHTRRLHDEQRLRSRWQGSNDSRIHHAILREKITRTVEFQDAVLLSRTKDTYVVDVALFGAIDGGMLQLQYASSLSGQFAVDDDGTQFRLELETAITDNGAAIAISNVWGFAGRWLVEVATSAEAQLLVDNLFALTDAVDGTDVAGLVEEIGWRPVLDDASTVKRVRAGYPLQGDELQPGRFCELRLVDLVGWCVYPLGKCDSFDWMPDTDTSADSGTSPDPSSGPGAV